MKQIYLRVKIFAINSLLFFIFFPKYFLFYLSAFRVAESQRKILLDIIRKNLNTLYGEKYNFDKVHTVQDFRNMVPVTTYESYSGYIEKIKNGEKNILTSDEVILLEPTSGSTAASKLIPYTKYLRAEFLNGIAPWIFFIFIKNINLLTKTSYWSLTPNIIKDNKGGKIKIGFENDAEYFGVPGKLFIKFLWSVPGEISEVSDESSFFYITLLFLLKDKNLGFISIWSPTYAHLLFKNLVPWMQRLLKDLENGTISCEFPVQTDLRESLEKKLKRNGKRAREIETIFNANGCHENLYERIWPRLNLISSWTDANSERYTKEIRKYFPNVKIQGKGLIATECIVSLPFYKDVHCLAARSHFFEFFDIEDNKIYLSHELKRGKRYSVIVTTGGGLYRYRLSDIIEIRGFYHKIPLIKFLGKEESVSDLFGEKLNEMHVKDVLEEAFLKFTIKPMFYLMAPEIEEGREYGYVLFIEGDRNIDYGKVADFMEEKLKYNFHYDYCRKLGQLKKLKIFLIENEGVKIYSERMSANGQKIGGIKPKILDNQLHWSKYFKGGYIHQEDAINKQK